MIIYLFHNQKGGAWRQYFGKTEVELGMVWLQVYNFEDFFIREKDLQNIIFPIFQGVVENLDKDSDWLEISEENNRVEDSLSLMGFDTLL